MNIATLNALSEGVSLPYKASWLLKVKDFLMLDESIMKLVAGAFLSNSGRVGGAITKSPLRAHVCYACYICNNWSKKNTIYHVSTSQLTTLTRNVLLGYTGVHCKRPGCNTAMSVIAYYTLPGVHILHSWAIKTRAQGQPPVRCRLITVTYQIPAALKVFIAKTMNLMNLSLHIRWAWSFQ